MCCDGRVGGARGWGKPRLAPLGVRIMVLAVVTLVVVLAAIVEVFGCLSWRTKRSNFRRGPSFNSSARTTFVSDPASVKPARAGAWGVMCVVYSAHFFANNARPKALK